MSVMPLRWQTLIVAGGVYLYEEDQAEGDAYLVAPCDIVVAEDQARERCDDDW